MSNEWFEMEYINEIILDYKGEAIVSFVLGKFKNYKIAHVTVGTFLGGRNKSSTPILSSFTIPVVDDKDFTVILAPEMHTTNLVMNVPNKVYFRVTTMAEDAELEPIEFSRAELIEYNPNNQEVVLANHISHLNNGMSAFVLTPTSLTSKYLLKVYRLIGEREVYKKFIINGISDSLTTSMTLIGQIFDPKETTSNDLLLRIHTNEKFKATDKLTV